MSLSLALNTALTGLHVNQRTMSVISNNIANANTEGYSRQIVDLSSVTYGGENGGVRVEDITRKVDKYLQISVRTQASTVGQSEVISEYYDSIQQLLGDPALNNSIDEHINVFFNDLAEMAETPERSSTRTALVESATILAREVSNLAYGLEELRLEADNEMGDAIETLNAKIEELFFINESINESNAIGSNTASLLDTRDILLDEISEYIDIRVNERETGAVDVYVGNGINILDQGYSRIEYDPTNNIQALTEDQEFEPFVVQPLNGEGQEIGQPINLVSGGRSSQIESRFDDGRLAGLLAMRDDVIPNILNQLDQLSSQLRDDFNAIHNMGSGYPPHRELEGTAIFDVNQRSLWSGSVTIAALNEDGTPVTSRFVDEISGARPLTMDLGSLYSGTNFGEIDMQTFINEINNHFGVPQNRLTVGNLNNVQLALVSDSVLEATPNITFDFDIENISDGSSDFWVDSIQVLDDTATDITSVSDTMPSIALDAASSFTTTAGSTTVTVRTDLNHGLSDGDMVRLDDPGMVINGIPASDFDGYFVVSNVTADTFEITVTTAAAGGGAVGVAGQTITPPYDTIIPGDKTRLQDEGTITANVAANTSSTYYDINVSMRVRDEDGNISTTTATYRVLNPQTHTENDRISATAVTAGSGTVIIPTDNRPLLRAMLVDEEGNELTNTAGIYGAQEGYLRIESVRDGITFAIDDESSKHLGLPSGVPPREGDGRGFSHHYGLNNFFSNNELTDTGDTLKNSALNLAIESRLRENPDAVSSGTLQLSAQTDGNPLYTLERYSGGQTIANKLAALGIESRSFAPSGPLPGANLNFTGYAGEILGYISANTIAADRTAENDAIILDGYVERAEAVSGVNLDEELANTIIYQNAFAASARVISVTDELFETLLNSL